MAARKVIRLADLEEAVGFVELPSGREVEVRPIDGAGQQLRTGLAAGTAKDADIWKFAKRLIPDATQDEIDSLTPTMIGVIAEIACGHLDRVLEYAVAAEKAAAGKKEAPATAAPKSDPESGLKTS